MLDSTGMGLIRETVVLFQVPSNYAPNYPIGHPRRGERTSGYSTLPHQSAAHVAPMTHNGGAGGVVAPPQVGMVHPMAHGGVPQGGSYGTPPPPPPHMQEPPQYAAHQINMPREFFSVCVCSTKGLRYACVTLSPYLYLSSYLHLSYTLLQ